MATLGELTFVNYTIAGTGVHDVKAHGPVTKTTTVRDAYGNYVTAQPGDYIVADMGDNLGRLHVELGAPFDAATTPGGT